MGAEVPDVEAGPPPPARVSIRLSNNWDASLSYDVLREPVENPSGRIFVGRQDLLGPLVNAIGQPDRRGTYLISGYRGAGKTSLVIEAARQARVKLAKDGWHLVPIVLNVSEVSASLSSGAEASVGSLQIDARRLLTALLRQLRNEFVVNRAEDLEALRRQQMRRTMRAAVENWVRRLFRRDTEPPIVDPNLKLAEKIDWAYRKADATEYVERMQRLRADRRTEAYESTLNLNLPNVLKLLAVCAAIAAAGIGIGIVADPVAAVTTALVGVALISFTWSRTVSRGSEQQESANVELTTDNSVHQLENDLKDILAQLHKLRYRAIVVLEELDKVDDSEGKQLEAVIRYFKNLFTQAPALFFFLTDKQYYDLIEARIEQARKSRTYSIEHTFFTHRLFVNRPTVIDCLEYLSNVVERKPAREALKQIGDADTKRVRDRNTMDLGERFIRVLLFRAQDHFFDLKNEIRRYLHVSNGRSVLECDDETLPLNEQAYAAFQFLVEQKARSYGFRGGREYANEVLRNCLFSVFNDSSSAEAKEIDSYYPLSGPDGDQLGATEAQRIREAVGALIEDLERGGAIERDPSSGLFSWYDNAAVLFSPVAKPEAHEAALVEALKRHIAILSAFGDGRVLGGVLPSARTVHAHELSRKLEADVRRVQSLELPLSHEDASSMTSNADAEVAKVLADAFDAHRVALEQRLKQPFVSMKTGASGSAWRLPAPAPASTPTPDEDLGDVLLVYGSGERVRTAVATDVANPARTGRFGLVHVAVEEPGSQWPTQQTTLKSEWEQLLAGAGERIACSVIPLHEDLASADDVAQRWGELTVDELILHKLWVERAWQRLEPQPAEVEAEGEERPTPAVGPFILRRGGEDAPEESFDNFDDLIRKWLANGDAALCWTAPMPTLAAASALFEKRSEKAGELYVYLPATATVADRRMDLFEPAAQDDVEGSLASVERLIGRGRIVLGIDSQIDARLPAEHPLPPSSRMLVHLDNPFLGQALFSPGNGFSIALRSDAPQEVYDLSDRLTGWNPDWARALRRLAANLGLPIAMGHLAWELRTSDPAESEAWRERLVATGDTAELERLDRAVREGRSDVAQTPDDQAPPETTQPSTRKRTSKGRDAAG